MAEPRVTVAVMTQATSDAEILAGLRAGDPDAARDLYARYGAAIYAFAYRRTQDAELSREIVQDVMTNAWRHARRFDDSRGALRSWIFEIARNATADAGRRIMSRPRLVEAERIDDGAADVADEIDAFLRSSLVRSALDRLPAEHREVVELVYFGQLKVADAAAKLGVPEGTVKSRCFYALKHLRAAFDEMGVTSSDL